MDKTHVLFPVLPVALLPGDGKYAGRQTCSLDQRSSNTCLGPVRKEANGNRSVRRARIPFIMHECTPQPSSSPGVPLVQLSWAFKHTSVEESFGPARRRCKVRARSTFKGRETNTASASSGLSNELPRFFRCGLL